MVRAILENEAQFEALMCELDEQFAVRGVKITARPWEAVRQVSIRLGVSLPVAGPSLKDAAVSEGRLSQKIQNWFKCRYGDRLNIDPSPGSSAVFIRSDVYLISYPRLWGSFKFLIDPALTPRNRLGVNEAPELNVLDSIIGLTSARAKTLSREELQAIGNAYYGGLQAHSVLEATIGSELLSIVRGDVETAVAKLVGQGARYGESRYASLQAAEKMVKAAIELEGKQYEFGHDLKVQLDHLAKLGVVIDQSLYVPTIQCGAGVRYGKEPSSERQAFAAHQATLALVLELVRAGAKFSTDLKWWMHPESTFRPI